MYNLSMGLILSVLFCFYGCSAKIADKDRGLVFDCVDFRDGEKFSFNTDSISDIVRTFTSIVSFKITTLEGNDLIIRHEQEAYIKCEKRK